LCARGLLDFDFDSYGVHPEAGMELVEELDVLDGDGEFEGSRDGLAGEAGLQFGGGKVELFRMSGTDLTQIDGLDVMTATTILSEAGWDMSKMGGRGPLRFLAAAVPGQSHQWQQDHWQRSAADEQSGQYRFADGS
jgi:hypothetical protein